VVGILPSVVLNKGPHKCEKIERIEKRNFDEIQIFISLSEKKSEIHIQINWLPLSFVQKGVEDIRFSKGQTSKIGLHTALGSSGYRPVQQNTQNRSSQDHRRERKTTTTQKKEQEQKREAGRRGLPSS